MPVNISRVDATCPAPVRGTAPLPRTPQRHRSAVSVAHSPAIGRVPIDDRERIDDAATEDTADARRGRVDAAGHRTVGFAARLDADSQVTLRGPRTPRGRDRHRSGAHSGSTSAGAGRGTPL